MQNDADSTVDAPTFVGPDDSQLSQDLNDLPLPQNFGPYRLIEKIGHGGMGVVYRCEDQNGSKIALKLLRNGLFAGNRETSRFRKEAILQSELQSDYVVQQVEFGEHDGRAFIASEFIDGSNLWHISKRIFSLGPEAALIIIRDVLTGLGDMHRTGMVHRDVKPSNILVSFNNDRTSENFSIGDIAAAKLTDLGLARYVQQSESLELTQTMTTMGTPLYMAPEQQSSTREAQGTADVYSVGCTLYALLAGQPPFQAKEAIQLHEMHRNEQPAKLTRLNPEVSEALNHVVFKSLEKDPQLRYQNADEMLEDIKSIISGQPIRFARFPRKSETKQKIYSFNWDLDCSAQQLWPFVAETDRFNRAIGLPAPEFAYEEQQGNRRLMATAKFNGLKVRWQEHAFEWIVNQRLSVLREFESGPFKWVTSSVFLEPISSGKTRLVHEFQVEPRGVFGQLVTAFQFGYVTRNQLNKVYRRIESLAKQTKPTACDASLNSKSPIKERGNKLLIEAANRISKSTGNEKLAASLVHYLRESSDSCVARIRPFSLADMLDVKRYDFMTTCLHAYEHEMLQSSWDIVCPVCRIATGIAESLNTLDDHYYCEACQQNFAVDFSSTVELVFSVHPTIRKVDRRTYCIGGPFHSPHVIAQMQFMPDETQQFGMDLAPGRHVLKSPQVEHQVLAEASALATSRMLNLQYPGGKSSSKDNSAGSARPGNVAIRIQNDTDKDVMLRFERSVDTGTSATAFAIADHPEFIRLFQDEINSIGDLTQSFFAYLIQIKIDDIETYASSVGESKANRIWSDLKMSLRQTGCSHFVIEQTFDRLMLGCEFGDDGFPDLLSVITDFFENSLPFSMLLSTGNLKHSGALQANNNTTESIRFFGKCIRELTADSANEVTQSNLLITNNLLTDDQIGTWLQSKPSIRKTDRHAKNPTFAIYEMGHRSE